MMNMRKEKGRKSFNYQEPFLDHILTMIMVVFPLNGSPVFFFSCLHCVYWLWRWKNDRYSKNAFSCADGLLTAAQLQMAASHSSVTVPKHFMQQSNLMAQSQKECLPFLNPSHNKDQLSWSSRMWPHGGSTTHNSAQYAVAGLHLHKAHFINRCLLRASEQSEVCGGWLERAAVIVLLENRACLD